MRNLHPGVLGGDGHIAQHGRIPMEAGAGDRADGGNVNIEHHVLDEVGIIKILMLEALSGQLGVGLPAVGVGLGHPAVADMSENDDLVLEIQRQDAGQLRAGAVRHTGMLHGAVVRLPGHLADAVLTVQIGKILEPLFPSNSGIYIICQRLVHDSSSFYYGSLRKSQSFLCKRTTSEIMVATILYKVNQSL